MSTSRPTSQSRIGKSLGAILSRPRAAVTDVEDDTETASTPTAPAPVAASPTPPAVAPTSAPIETSVPAVEAAAVEVPTMAPPQATPAGSAPSERATAEPGPTDDAPVPQAPGQARTPQVQAAAEPQTAAASTVAAEPAASAARFAQSKPSRPAAPPRAPAAAIAPDPGAVSPLSGLRAPTPTPTAVPTTVPTGALAPVPESWSAPVAGLDVEEERVPAGKKRETFLIPTDLADEMRDAVVHLAGPPLYLTLAAFGEHAVRRYLEELKQQQNGGAAFPKRPRPVRQGRPLR